MSLNLYKLFVSFSSRVMLCNDFFFFQISLSGYFIVASLEKFSLQIFSVFKAGKFLDKKKTKYDKI